MRAKLQRDDFACVMSAAKLIIGLIAVRMNLYRQARRALDT